MNISAKSHLTKRALDWRVCGAFSSVFFGSNQFRYNNVIFSLPPASNADRWAFDDRNKMKRFLHLLTLVILSLTTSSCGVLWSIYESQQNYLAPHHDLETNNEYEVLWNLSDINAGGSFTKPMIVGAPNKIIIMGTRKGKIAESTILAIESNSGKTLWEERGFSGDIITSDKAVYVGTEGTATVHSFNIEDGKSLWSTRLPWAHSTSDIYFAENTLFVHTNDSEFFVLNEQGEIVENFREDHRTFLELNGVLYMENTLGIRAVELATKQELWSLYVDDPYIHAPIFDDGEIFLRTRHTPAKIYSIDQYIGKVNWVISQNPMSNLCLVGEKIYFTDIDGNLIAINRYTGSEVSRAKFSPQFDLNKQISDYSIACDSTSNVLALSFGDNTQIMGLRIVNP